MAGGAGFLGSHLCEALLTYGHHVVGVDNFDTGLEQNLLVLRRNPAFGVVVHDVIDPVDGPRQRCPDISLAQWHLGWNPKVHLAEGLARTINHFDSLLSRASNIPAQLQPEYSR